MDAKLKKIAESITSIIELNYKLAQEQIDFLEFLNLSREPKSLLNKHNINSIEDKRLEQNLQKNNILLRTYRQQLPGTIIISGYLGEIIQQQDQHYLCTRSKNLKGIEFYESYTGENPLPFKEFPLERIIDQDNIKKGFQTIYNNQSAQEKTNAYINQLLVSELNEEILITSNLLKNELKKSKIPYF